MNIRGLLEKRSFVLTVKSLASPPCKKENRGAGQNSWAGVIFALDLYVMESSSAPKGHLVEEVAKYSILLAVIASYFLSGCGESSPRGSDSGSGSVTAAPSPPSKKDKPGTLSTKNTPESLDRDELLKRLAKEKNKTDFELNSKEYYAFFVSNKKKKAYRHLITNYENIPIDLSGKNDKSIQLKISLVLDTDKTFHLVFHLLDRQGKVDPMAKPVHFRSTGTWDYLDVDKNGKTIKNIQLSGLETANTNSDFSAQGSLQLDSKGNPKLALSLSTGLTLRTQSSKYEIDFANRIFSMDYQPGRTEPDLTLVLREAEQKKGANQ